MYNTSQCKLPPSPTQKLAVFTSQHCIIKIAGTCKYLVLSQGLFNDSGKPGWDAYRDPAHHTNSKECLYDLASLVPRRYVLFYGLRGLCVGRVDQFDRFRCEAPGRIRFDFWSGLRFLERTQ